MGGEASVQHGMGRSFEGQVSSLPSFKGYDGTIGKAIL
jgi:hypothetical protein